MTVNDLVKPRCRAHNRQGNQCGRMSCPGARVCRMHGGAAPQVIAAAGERIKALAPRAVDVLEELLDASDQPGAIRLATAKDILDRAGYKPKERVETTLLAAFTLRIDRGTDDNDDNG